MNRKGTAAIIATVIIISVVASAILGWNIYSMASFKTAERIEDLENYVKTNALSSYFNNFYINQSLLYTSWQKSYELGLKGGGIEIWPEEPPKIEYFEKKLAKEIDKSPYIRNFYGNKCNVIMPKYESEITEKFYDDSFLLKVKGNAAEFYCRGEDIENKVYSKFDREIESINNRYFYLLNSSREFAINLKERLDKIPDPSEKCPKCYYGIGVGPEPETSKKAALEIAKTIAEMDYRSKILKAIGNSLDEAEEKLGEDLKLEVKNKRAIASPNLLKRLGEGILPKIIKDLNNAREKLRASLINLKNKIREILGGLEISTEDIKKIVEEGFKTAENLKQVLDKIKLRIDEIFEKAEILSKILDFRNNLKEKVEALEINENFLREKVKEWLGKENKKNAEKMADHVTAKISKFKKTFSAKSNGSNLNKAELQSEKINWTKIRESINNTDFSSLTNDIKLEVKEKLKEEIDSFMKKEVEERLFKFIEEQNLSFKISVSIEIQNIKGMIKKVMSENLKEPLESTISAFSINVNETIEKAVDEIINKIEKELSKAFNSADFKIFGDLKKEVVKRIEDKAIEKAIKDLGEYVANAVKEELEEFLNKEIENSKRKFLGKINSEIGEKLKLFDLIGDNITAGIELSLEKFAKSTVNSTKKIILELVDKKTEEIFNLVGEEIDGKLLVAEEIKPIILKAIEKVERENPKANSEITLAKDKKAFLASENEILEKIKEEVKESLMEYFEDKANEVYSKIEPFQRKFKEELKSRIDKILDLFDINEKLENEKNKIKKEVNKKFDEMDKALDEVVKSIDKAKDLLELEEKIENIVDGIENKIDEIVEKLSFTEGKNFDFEFFDEKVLLTFPVLGLGYVSLASTRIDPIELNVKVEAKDEKYFLPVSTGYENIRIVFTYNYIFEN